jgi:hypothetical protein
MEVTYDSPDMLEHWQVYTSSNQSKSRSQSHQLQHGHLPVFPRVFQDILSKVSAFIKILQTKNQLQFSNLILRLQDFEVLGTGMRSVTSIGQYFFRAVADLEYRQSAWGMRARRKTPIDQIYCSAFTAAYFSHRLM